MAGQRKQRVQLRMETLEDRTAPAVIAFVDHGDLRIKPTDGAADTITITQTAPGSYTVTGSGGTVVNGVADNAVTLTGVTRDFRINTGGGNDTLTLDTVTVPRNLKIETGSGDDIVTLTGVTVTNKTKSINTGSGDDTINIDGSTFNGKFKLKTKKGNDTV